MKILGIETSCDECAAAVVEDGRTVLSNVVATQIPWHAPWNGVVPEIASRMHTEWIMGVVKEALSQAGLDAAGIDGVAATSRPGLLGSLLVGLSFAKAFAWARRLPFIAVDHILAHLYAGRLDSKKMHPEGGSPPPGGSPNSSEAAAGSSAAPPNGGSAPVTPPPGYPFLGLLVSGGHTIVSRVDDFDRIAVLGTTIDDAAGEAFDKVSKHYGFGYPGGAAIDRLAKEGSDEAFRFPMPKLHKGEHRCDVSYSGLKNAVINQKEQFRVPGRGSGSEDADIAASFQKTAVEILLRALFNALEDTGIRHVAAGGGAAANSLLRARLAAHSGIVCHFPPLEYCGDNGAMIAGIGWQYFMRGETSPWSAAASARVPDFRRRYPWRA